MSLAAVIKALHTADIQPTGLEIAEALWLAQHLVPPPTPTEAPRQESPVIGQDDEQTATPMPPSEQSSNTPVALSNTNAAVSGSRVRGHPVRIPDLPGLHRPRDIQRALRPLRQHGPSRRRHVIDEDATATFIANTGVWAPVMRPAPERWFDVILAVDSSSSMDLWRPLVNDLGAVLANTGAFRDVRTWWLTPQQQGTTVRPSPRAAARSPRELIDGAGRRLFLVVTDGAAHGWHDGSATKALSDWGKTGPAAVLQPLPEEMWTRTGLATVPARLSTNASGTRNSQLHVDYRRRRRSTSVPIPVLGIEPDALHSWARLIAGSASAVPLAVAPVNDGRPILPSLTGENESGSAVDSFRASASPQAYKLAVCLSAVPLTLPIMRLVQHVTVPASNPSALAEVILGGLVSRTGENTYEFLPEIRDALFSELRRSEITTVFSAISDYIAEHADMAGPTFPAIAETADGPVAADAEAFSWVPPAVAARLGLPDVSPQHAEDQSPDQAILLNDERQDEQSVTGAGQFDEDYRSAEPSAPTDASDAGIAIANAAPGDVHAAPMRSAYLEQVRQIAPATLLGRERELAELAEFCTRPDPAPSYLWLQASPWAGKSALMSWMVLHPPPGIRMVSFFITGRLASDNREAFMQVLLEQLAELSGQALPPVLTEAARESYLLDSLTQAAVACQRAGSRLVLAVDGLDEDRGATTGPDAHSIAALLPADPPTGMRVIVAGRPNRPIAADVPRWHPLRDPERVHLLNIGSYARNVERPDEQEPQDPRGGSPEGHVFISYFREDTDRADQLHATLEAAGIPVWRDTSDLWPGEDWRVKIRSAITSDALVFLACFSNRSLGRPHSYQREELVLAVEQLRMRRPDDPWLIPIRFDNCEISDMDIGGGRTLSSIQRVDLFGEHYDEQSQRLVAAILRIFRRRTEKPSAPRKLRILVVEDSADWHVLVARLFPEHLVDSTQTFADAAKRVQPGGVPYDVAIVDLNLLNDPANQASDTLGGDILLMLRRNYPSTLRIAMTGSIPSGGLRRGVVDKYQVHDLFIKSAMDMSDLRSAVLDSLAASTAPLEVERQRAEQQERLRAWAEARRAELNQETENLQNELRSSATTMDKRSAETAARMTQLEALASQGDALDSERARTEAMLHMARDSEDVARVAHEIDRLMADPGAGRN